MKQKRIAWLLVLVLLLCGCGRRETQAFSPDKPEEAETAMLPATEATVPPTVAPDGNPEDVTCKGAGTAEIPA